MPLHADLPSAEDEAVLPAEDDARAGAFGTLARGPQRPARLRAPAGLRGDRRRPGGGRDRLRAPASPHARALPGCDPGRRRDHGVPGGRREPAPGAHVSESELVFVGGTGRSGTTVLAELLGRHSHFCDVPIECRFHCNPSGLADVVGGRATPEQFVRKLRSYWWHRVRTGSRVIVPAGIAGRARFGALHLTRRLGLGHEESRVRGLHQIIDRDRFDAAAARFEQTHGDDLLEASRRLFYDLLELVRARSGKPALVEMSTFTIAAAPELARIFPEARFVHSVRDGRDSGVSKVGLAEKAHHPTDAISGIDFWADRLRLADIGARGLSADERSRLHLISLDELVWADREG